MLPDTLRRPRILFPAVILLIISIYVLTRDSLSLWANPATPFPKFPQEAYQYPAQAHNQTRPKRVAIIGAGASGSSAAWFLRRAGDVVRERTGEEVLGEIVVFEREGYVGGRSTVVYPHGDTSLRPIELGASIFVDANKHMIKAAKRFGLETIDPDFGETGLGIWDGTSFLYKTSPSTSWFSDYLTALSAIRRYGPASPLRTKKAVSNLLSKFANLYNPTFLAQRGPVHSVEDFAETVGLGNELTTRFGDDWAKSLGLGDKWIGEIMEGSTRCNYAADMDGIHGLGAGVSMAAAGARAVEGGNWRVFEGMLKESKATIRLETQVKDVIATDHADGSRTFIVSTNTTSVTDDEPFDQIFWASPWLNSPNDRGMHGLTAYLEVPMHYQPYVLLHVTLLTTTRSSPNPSFFNFPPNTVLPTTILTTGYTSRSTPQHPPPRFQSITWHGETYPGSGEWVVKIFSKTRLTDRFISQLLGEEPGWLLRKGWNSYPVLKPTGSYAAVEPVRGVQYLGAMETWVSTMETQTISGREAVARVVSDWWGLGLGECRGGAEAWDWSCEE